ncbi:MAG: DUF308 domain-containing protein, partial [Acidimicrobiia bacterium]
MRAELQEREVTWINPATTRGAAFVVAGLFILAVPEASARMLGLILAIALVFMGGTDLWGATRVSPTPWTAVFLGLVSLVAGAGIIFMPDLAFGILAKVFAILLALRGVTVSVRAFRERHTSDAWTFNLVRGSLSVATAVIIFVIPDAIATTLVLAIAATALISGAIMISYGMTSADADHLGAVELGGFIKRWLGERDVGEETRRE